MDSLSVSLSAASLAELSRNVRIKFNVEFHSPYLCYKVVGLRFMLTVQLSQHFSSFCLDVRSLISQARAELFLERVLKLHSLFRFFVLNEFINTISYKKNYEIETRARMIRRSSSSFLLYSTLHCA